MTSVVRKSLRHAALAIAVGFTLLGMNPVLAQTNAVGSIFGSADAAGGKVVITNTDTGAVRSTSVDASGRFQVTALPPGTYKVELQKDGQTVGTRSGVNVVVGQGAEVSFGGTATELDNLTVTAKAGQFDIDVSATDTRTVFTSAELEKLTVGRSIEDVQLLAPGAVRGDSRYVTDKGGATASFGGAGANENAFYINGYAVTDPQKGFGSSSLPFAGIAQLQLLTGGYGAEFGRATGGVVNIVTKRGTNNWEAGGIVTYEPKALRAHERDIRFPNNGASTDGTFWRETSERENDSMLYGAYVGGPIIKDKAFFYLNAEFENRTIEGPRTTNNASGTTTTGGSSGWHDRDIDVPRYLAKADWTIVDGHTLELTAISDVRKETRKEFGYYYVPGGRLATTDPTDDDDVGLPESTKGALQNGGREFEEGGELYLARYTGALMDNLILTALIGGQKNNHFDDPYRYDPSVTPVRDLRPGGTVSYGSVTTLNDPRSYDKTDGYRLDLEWLAAAHSVRVGYDVQNLEYKDGRVTAGPGYFWVYQDTPVGQESAPIQGGGGAIGPGGNGEYVTKNVSALGGTFTTDQYAYFVEDRWQVTDNVLLSLGLRNENFENFNSDGVTFLDQTDQWAPRLGVTWDVFGDSSLRTFANVGRYHLAIPLNVAFRQVGGSTNTTEYFSFTSIDPNTGEPQGTAHLVGNTGPYSSNNEYGQARDPALSAADGLDSYYQDEFVLGLESKLMPSLVGGARFIYRDLGSQIDDNCDPRPAYNWAVHNGLNDGTDADSNGLDDGAEFYASQLAECRIINPGEANTLLLEDPAGNRVRANISAAEWGLPALKREYQGLDLFLEHPLRDNWYGKLDWTISRSEGNAEGQLNSDSGQQDVAVTANWDQPEIMAGADGYLPNDRRHQIKAWGFYQFSPEWRVSSTLTSASGRPVSEIGFYEGAALLEIATDPSKPIANPCDADCYFNSYAAYAGDYYQHVPRGSAGRLPWTTVLDVGAQYAPNVLKNQLTVGLDVFNVFNTQKPQSKTEFQDAASASRNKFLSYNAPRAVRFMVRYDWGL